MANKHPLAKCYQCTLVDEPYVPSEIPDDWTGKYLIVGQQPGHDELRDGRPFVGMSGKVLRPALEGAGFEDCDVAYTNAILCGAPRQREPTEHELWCCKGRLMQGVSHAGRVLAVGKHAATSILGLHGFSVFKERGCYRYADGGTPVLPTLHPAYVLREPVAARDLFDDIEKFRKEPYHEHYADTKWAVATPADVLGWISRIRTEGQGTVISFDLECDNRPWPNKSRYLVSPHRDRVLCGSFSWRNGHALVVPGDLLLAFSAEWRSLFADPGLTWTGHNLKFDYKMIECWLGAGSAPSWTRSRDTLLMHYALDERPGTHALKPRLIGYYLDWDDYEQDLIQKHLKSKRATFGSVPLDDLYTYSALDADAERRLYLELQPLIESQGLSRLVDDLLHPAQAVLQQVELRGIKVDLNRLHSIREAYVHMAEESRVALREHVVQLVHEGHTTSKAPHFKVSKSRLLRTWEHWEVFAQDFNPASHQQVVAVLYALKRYTVPKGRTIKTKSGYSSNKEALTKLEKNYPGDEFLGLLKRHRTQKKMIRTYCDNIEVLAFEGSDPTQPWFYPDYRLHGTETGRLSGGLGMTFPKTSDKEMGEHLRIRSVFVAQPGNVILSVDYSQAELRALGWYSRDPFLLKVYQEGRDLHNEVALKLFGKPRSELDGRINRAVKAWNFGWAYRIKGGEEEFVEGLNIDTQTAHQMVLAYNEQLAGALEWKKRQIEVMRREQEVVTPTGRHRRFPLLVNSNEDEAYKAGINMPIQSLSSDLILMTMIEIDRTKLFEEHPTWDAHICLMMHDELVIECRADRADDVAKAVIHIMVDVVPPKVGITPDLMPLAADYKVGDSWGGTLG